MELEVDSENDNLDRSKIELTKAEAEALDRGLQVLISVLDFMLITSAIVCFFPANCVFICYLEIAFFIKDICIFNR